MSAPLVLVDAENVRRSLWPNLTPEELVERSGAFAERESLSLELVFDGPAPAVEAPAGLALLGSGDGSADDVIARRAEELRAAGEPFWLVTSDRALRAAAGAGAERVVGGGTFARRLEAPTP